MSIDNFTISAVITTYNRASIVPRAIASVLAQTRPVEELIVVDDGSRDNTAEVVGSYGPPVRYVHQENRGLSAARNTGAREARGGWIAFLDDDDEWLPDKIERQVAVLKENPAASLCYGGALWVDRNGGTEFLRPLPPDRLWPAIRMRSPITPCASMVRRDAFLESGGFDERLRCVEDWEFAIRFVQGRQIAVVEGSPLVKVYEDPNSMSKDANSMLAAELSILDSLLTGLRGPSRFFWRRRILSRMFYRAAISYREQRRPCLQHIFRSLLCWPSPLFEPRRFVTAAVELRDALRR